MRKSLFAAPAAVVLALLAGAAQASAAVVINEVESKGKAGVIDWIELANTGNASVDVSGYILKDDEDKRTFALPAGTTIPAHGYYAVDVDVPKPGFGLGNPDKARLFLPDGATELDGYAWKDHAPATYGRCADSTGPITWTNRATKGAANDCPAAAPAWPGSPSVTLGDAVGVFGPNLSGVAYQASGTSAPGVLWAVQNGPSTLYRLLWDGSKWVRDTANGWGMGKQLVYADGAGVPDAEGVTLVGGELYVSTERNDDVLNSSTSRPSVLRYDVSGAGAVLKAASEWNLVADLPGMDANEGLEAITWVPDELLVAKGFRDEAKGAAYNPASYPGHGNGLFLVGVEQDDPGIYAYALNANGSFTLLAKIVSGLPRIADLAYEPESTHVWVACDNGCDGRTGTLDIGLDGRFAFSGSFQRPADMPNLNNEGFTLAPQAECVNGLKPVFYTDDSATDGHALRMGKIKCTPIVPKQDPTPTPTPLPQTFDTTTTTTTVHADRTAPQVKLAVKLTKTLRRTGAFNATLTLDERANLTIAATAGQKGKKARSILKTTRNGVAAGQGTLKLTLSRKFRAKLRKGETLTLTVGARDMAGNVTTARASAKVS